MTKFKSKAVSVNSVPVEKEIIELNSDDVIKTTIWDRLKCRSKDFWELISYNLPRFFKNVWLFRRSLWNYTWYNGHNSVLPFVKTSVDHMVKHLEIHGHEVIESRSKKIQKMKRLSYLLDVLLKGDYIELAEVELGPLPKTKFWFVPTAENPDYFEMKNNRSEAEEELTTKIYDRSQEIEMEHWVEICRIIQGPDYKVLFKDGFDWDRDYDGTDLRAWWD